MLIEKIVCNHDFKYEGELPIYFWYHSENTVSKYCYVRCSKCGARKIVSLNKYRKMVKKGMVNNVR